MKVKQIKQRGEPVWLVDGKIDGKRKRMFFGTKVRPSIGSQTIGSRRSQVRIKRFAHRCLDCANAVVNWSATTTTCGGFFPASNPTCLVMPVSVLQMKVTENGGRPDTLANDLIERAWRDWARSESCTVTGRMTWFDVQRLALRSTARDGDCILRMIRDAQGFRLQLLEGDRLDINYNLAKLDSGNEVRMGVEIDRFGRPVAYHLLDKHPSDVSAVQAKRERIPADQVIHPFITDRIAQTRGTPWMVSAMTRLQMLGAYEEAELTAARVAASKMGFLVKERSEGYIGDTDEAGNTLMEVEPGAIEELPMGTTFQSWNPDHPVGNYAGFVKSCLRGIAAGLGVSYNMLANDLEGVNYSSIRAGLLDEREYYKAVQRWFTDTVITPVFEGWLETNILNGTINLPAAKLDKFNAPDWKPRRWAWVDPLKDQQASILAVENHLKSKRQVISRDAVR